MKYCFYHMQSLVIIHTITFHIMISTLVLEDLFNIIQHFPQLSTNFWKSKDVLYLPLTIDLEFLKVEIRSFWFLPLCHRFRN